MQAIKVTGKYEAHISGGVARIAARGVTKRKVASADQTRWFITETKKEFADNASIGERDLVK